jgi:hypothetical protein
VPLPWVMMVAGISRIPLATPDNRLRLVASSLRASFRPLQVTCRGSSRFCAAIAIRRSDGAVISTYGSDTPLAVSPRA